MKQATMKHLMKMSLAGGCSLAVLLSGCGDKARAPVLESSSDGSGGSASSFSGGAGGEGTDDPDGQRPVMGDFALSHRSVYLLAEVPSAWAYVTSGPRVIGTWGGDYFVGFGPGDPNNFFSRIVNGAFYYTDDDSNLRKFVVDGFYTGVPDDGFDRDTEEGWRSDDPVVDTQCERVNAISVNPYGDYLYQCEGSHMKYDAEGNAHDIDAQIMSYGFFGLVLTGPVTPHVMDLGKPEAYKVHPDEAVTWWRVARAHENGFYLVGTRWPVDGDADVNQDVLFDVDHQGKLTELGTYPVRPSCGFDDFALDADLNLYTYQRGLCSDNDLEAAVWKTDIEGNSDIVFEPADSILRPMSVIFLQGW